MNNHLTNPNHIETKQQAIEYLCNYATTEGMAPHQMKSYKMVSELFGITRGDYYNALGDVSEAEELANGPMWMANKDNRKENLYLDLRREARGIKYLELAIAEGVRDDSLLDTYQYEMKMIIELMQAIQKEEN